MIQMLYLQENIETNMELTSENIKKIIENDCQLPPEESIENITPLLIPKLGFPDSDSREGALEILYTWIMEGKYSDTALIQLGDQFCDLIQTNVGTFGEDSTFLRAFSALEICGILKFDDECALGNVENRISFLSPEIFTRWLEKAMNYYRQEKDYRSFIPEKGWAHSIAHGADLFRDFLKHHLIRKTDVIQILDLLLEKAFSSNNLLLKGKEDARIATAFYTGLLHQDLLFTDIQSLFNKFMTSYKNKGWFTWAQEPSASNGFLNGERFIYDLYFMLKFGISRKGSRSVPYYEQQIQFREELILLLENFIQILDNGSFYLFPSTH